MEIKKAKRIIPAGHRVIVQPDDVNEKTESGIIIAHENKNRTENAQISGVIKEIGPSAWKDFSGGEPWASVGDRVLFASNAGYVITCEDIKYRVMNDEDITAIIYED